MAKILRVSEVVRNAMLEALLAAIDAESPPGELRLYSGAQPATPETAPGVGNTLLATLLFSDPVGAVAGGVLTFGPISDDVAADATGFATWGRIVDGSGEAIFDGNAGVGSGFVIQLNSAAVEAGGPVRMNVATVTFPVTV